MKLAAHIKSAFAMGVLYASACNPTMAAEQAYPNKAVTLVMPFAAGGGADATARLIADSLTQVFGQQFIVENRAGAAGSIGYGYIARAPKDGYHILVSYSAATSCNPSLYADVDWDPVKDFTPAGTFAASPLLFAVNPSIPANTLDEFAAYLKEHPGEVNYGTSGIGSASHIVGELFQQKTGTKMVHIPYKGSGPAVADGLAGVVQLLIPGTASVLQHVQAGKLKALATTGTERDAALPDVPTVAEAGVSGTEFDGWYGLFVPAGTPQEIVSTLTDGLKRATENPEFIAKSAAAAVQVRYLGPDATTEIVKNDIEVCKEAVVSAGIKIE